MRRRRERTGAGPDVTWSVERGRSARAARQAIRDGERLRGVGIQSIRVLAAVRTGASRRGPGGPARCPCGRRRRLAGVGERVSDQLRTRASDDGLRGGTPGERGPGSAGLTRTRGRLRCVASRIGPEHVALDRSFQQVPSSSYSHSKPTDALSSPSSTQAGGSGAQPTKPSPLRHTTRAGVSWTPGTQHQSAPPRSIHQPWCVVISVQGAASSLVQYGVPGEAPYASRSEVVQCPLDRYGRNACPSPGRAGHQWTPYRASPDHSPEEASAPAYAT